MSIVKKYFIYVFMIFMIFSGCAKISKADKSLNIGREISYNIKSDDGTEILNVKGKIPSGNITEKISEEIDHYYSKIDLEYQEKLKNELAILAEEQYQISKENGYSFRPYSVEQNFTVTYESDNVISIVRNIQSYTGGLHENQQVFCETFFLLDGQKMFLKDLFLENSDYETKILSELQNTFYEMKHKSPDVFFDNADEFLISAIKNESFYLTNESLVFVYPSYVLAPYTEGVQYLQIDRENLHNIFAMDW